VKTIFSAFALSFALLLAGCATVPYGRDTGYGGYTDGPVEKNLYRVVYTSPGGLDDSQISDLALLRAAEVSRDHGYPWFSVVRADKGYTTRAALNAYPGVYTGYYSRPVWVSGPSSYVYNGWDPYFASGVAIPARYEEFYIRGYTRQAADGTSYRADAVITNLRARYQLNGT
jgi:hypothetical protein